MEKIVFLYDSACTIGDEEAKKLNAIKIPLMIIEGEKIFNDLPEEINSKQIIDGMKKGLSYKTSMTSLGKLIVMIEELSEKYDRIIFFPVSKGLSGQYDQAKNLESQYPKFSCIDARDGLDVTAQLMREARALLQKGGSLQQIQELANKRHTKFGCMFALNSVEGLIRSGRAGKTLGGLAKALKIKILVNFSTSLEKVAFVTKMEKALDRMLAFLKAKLKLTDTSVIKRICIYDGAASPKLIEYLISKCKQVLKISYDPEILFLPNIFVVHAYENALGLTIEVE
ncbi:unnamed protein product [Didymodactylos carnosus]|uniref:DegV family protein n=1 Tax=Didymodactylos carnosus TaxID=1234261 RepID=A0A8S2CJT8_9BILA|nr:unnamed protein product [Didymodactylos carnosus]CAF3491661.1 unnamed protein product [Didymodactylos carnosus]